MNWVLDGSDSELFKVKVELRLFRVFIISTKPQKAFQNGGRSRSALLLPDVQISHPSSLLTSEYFLINDVFIFLHFRIYNSINISTKNKRTVRAILLKNNFMKMNISVTNCAVIRVLHVVPYHRQTKKNLP